MNSFTENKENKLLMDIVSNALFKTEKSLDFDNVSFEKLMKESAAQTVTALCFDEICQLDYEYDKEEFSKWRKRTLKTFSNNINILKSEIKLHSLLEEAEIKAVTIKGSAIERYYPKRHLRQMGDIDFLVAPEDFEKTKDLLLLNGFEFVEEHSFHAAFKKDGVLYECHINIGDYSEEHSLLNYVLGKVIDSRVEYITDLGKIYVTDVFSTGLIVLLHMHRHIANCSGIGLRHLCDWAVFVNSFTEEKLLSTFEEGLKEIGLWKFARVIAQTAEEYIGLPHKGWYGNREEELVNDLITEVFEGGNFGRKESSRAQSEIFVSREGNRRFLIFTVVKKINRKIYSWKLFYRKHKLLLPIGYIGYFARLLYQIIFGKKRVSVKSTVSRGIERNNFLAGLEILKPEKEQKAEQR